MTTNIQKQLAAVQDLSLGTGTEIQRRNGVDITVDRISIDFVFDTVAQMKAATDIVTAAGLTVRTKGYYEAGDGGHADYYIKTAAAFGGVPDELGNHTLANGNIAALQTSASINPKQYGARTSLSVDSTANFNAALGADLDYGDYKEICLDLQGEDFAILGTVYVRKGQNVIGSGSHVFMSDTGSFKCGFKSDGTPDPGGHPIVLAEMWIEGGNKPIDCFVSGYTVRDIFNSFAAVGMQLGGSDGHISNVTVDNGTTLMACSASNSTFVNCNFYIGVTQLDLTGAMRDTVFSNCVFNYGNTYGIRIYDPAFEGRVFKNIRFDGCSFKKNAQDAGSFQGFIFTNNSTIQGDITFSDCNFRNCYRSAITAKSSSSALELNFDGCIFDGDKTNDPYAQSTTMFALEVSGSGKNVINMNNCRFKNLLDTPIQLSGNESYAYSLTNAEFSNNAGTYNIDISGANGNSSVTLANIDSGGKALFSQPTTGSLEVYGYLRNWLEQKNTSGRDYVEVPYYGSTMLAMDVSMNRNPGGSTLYRQLSKFIATIGFDFQGGSVTQGTITETFASTSPLGGTLDIQLDIDAVGTGIQKAGNQDKGLMVISWPEGYGFEKYETRYELIGG